MSLTSELKKRNGAVRRFFETQFPEMGGLRSKWNDAIGGVEPIRPKGVGRPPYSTIGTAFDYRLRFAFDGGADIGRLLATVPAQILSLLASEDGPFIAGPKGPFVYQPRLGAVDQRPPDLDVELMAAVRGIRSADIGVGVLLPNYFSILTNDLSRIEPAGKELEPEDENLLDRHCYLLALLDELFRGGYHIRSPLFRVAPTALPQALLDLGAPWSEDLATLYQLFWDKHRSLLDLPATTNPHFAGSAPIGGADGDLIVDHQLIEIKTTIKTTLGREWVWQLIGYLLLDWSNAHHIRSLGLYSSRHGVLATWPTDELLSLASNEGQRPIADLRDKFREIVLERETM